MKLLHNLSKFTSYLTAFTLVLLVALILYDATSRYLFSSGSTALQELEWHFFDLIILLSISFTFKHNAHVRVDIFYAHFSKKIQKIIDIFATLFFVLPLALLIIYIGYGFTELSLMQNEASSDPGGLTHRWIVKSLMPLAFIFLALQALQELYKNIKEWRSL